MADWSVYLIRTQAGALYAGIATNVQRRLAEHEQSKRGSKYLRSKGPLEVIYQVELGSRSLASKVEYKVKKLTKAQKEKIAIAKLTRPALLAFLKISDEPSQ